VVEEVGEGVTMTKPGDRVVVSLLRACGRCEACQRGTPQHCAAQWPLDSASRIRNKDGQPVKHGVRVGGFAEYAIVDQSQVVPLPPEMDLVTASLLGCGVITGYGAVVNTAQVQPGSTVVFLGAGGVGLNAVQGAALAGAGRVITVDLLDNKLDAATNFGATDVINAAEADPVEAVREMTKGGVDYSFEALGLKKTAEQAFQMLRPSGAATIIGMVPEGQMLEIHGADLLDDKKLQGSNMGSNHFRVDMPNFVEFYLNGKLKLDDMISQRIPLEGINEAFEEMKRGEVARSVIVFDA
jgi:S-(hydroxymethyl)glutathione dehydrogenase/alcohol dehydrogenase